MKHELMKSGLGALYFSGTHRLLAPYTQGVGLIFMLHRVCPGNQPAFAPNGILTITPDFLESVIEQVREAGLDIVDLDEAAQRIVNGQQDQRFVCFTLDDGYRDNMEHAWPIFRKHGVPFTIYVSSDYAGGKGQLWWVALERVIAGNAFVEVDLGDGPQMLATDTPAQKQDVFQRCYDWLRRIDENKQRAFIDALCVRYDFDQEALCCELIMSWDEIREMDGDPLVTIGAHTVGHYAVAKLPEARARKEMKLGAERIEEETGRRPRHLSYPYGDAGSAGPRDFELAAKLGFRTAVTTRKGVLFANHANHLTALPRVSLNGAYQSLIYTSLYLTGAPFALWNGFRKVDAD